RYTYFLQRGVFNAAYFTKASCWSYEQERRMIVPPSNTWQASPLILLDAPNDCITSIICGPRASDQMKRALIQKAEEIDCRYFELRIGKRSAIPYFVDTDGKPFSFDSEIVPSHQYCETCKKLRFAPESGLEHPPSQPSPASGRGSRPSMSLELSFTPPLRVA